MSSLRMIAMTSLASAALFGGDAAIAAKPARPANADVEAEAMQALKRMAVYLGGLQTFEVKSDTTEDAVLETGQKLQFTRQVTYRVRRPDGFAITSASDRKVRRFLYDGKQLTVVAPRDGFFATVDAPPTIRAVLDDAWRKYDIALPLEDLFRWGGADDRTAGLVKAAYEIGYAKIDGHDCDQYAFRGPDQDWQLWIERGPEPLPLKVVITDRLDEAHPQYSAVLSWNLKPAIGPKDFTFQPTTADHRIRLASR